MSMSLVAFSSEDALSFPSLQGLTAIGGAHSTGLKLRGLKHSDDYAVIGESNGQLVVHALKGKKRGAITLERGKVFTIDDLTLGFFQSEPARVDASGNFLAASADDLLRLFSSRGNLAPALDW